MGEPEVMSSVGRFIAHLNDTAPRFVCSPADGDRGRRIEVPVTHVLEAPAAPLNLDVVIRLLDLQAADVIELYSRHDGLDLYVQGGASSALTFYPVNQWERATRDFRRDFEEWGRDEDDLFDFETQGIVFGEPPASGNAFLLYRGAVYYSNHDGGDDTPLAPTFAAFMDRIVDDPAKLLFDLGCYARYSDGVTDTQWIPERYVSRERPA
jgi:hypothetical protein